MKKLIISLTVMCFFFVGSISTSAEIHDNIRWDARPGQVTAFGIGVDPYQCRAGVANEGGSGDHLYGSLYDGDGNFTYGPSVEPYSVARNSYYYTPYAYSSCDYMDGSYGQVRNQNYVTEKFVVRYEFYR